MELVSEHMELVLDFIFLIINIVSLVKEKKMSYRVGGWEVKKKWSASSPVLHYGQLSDDFLYQCGTSSPKRKYIFLFLFFQRKKGKKIKTRV